MYTINPGEFRHFIDIYRLVNEVDNDGIPTENTELLYSCKAKITNTSGKELMISSGTTSILKKRFIIRHNRAFSINSNDFIIYNGKRYNIIYCNDIEEARKYIEIIAEVVE